MHANIVQDVYSATPSTIGAVIYPLHRYLQPFLQDQIAIMENIVALKHINQNMPETIIMFVNKQGSKTKN